MRGVAQRRALGRLRRKGAPAEGPRLSQREGLVEEPDARAGNEHPKASGNSNSTGLIVQESSPDAQHVKRTGREDKPETVTNRISRRGQLLPMGVAMEYREDRDDQRCDPHRRL